MKRKTTGWFRLLQVLKGKRGFTLIEVILSMSISTILLVALAMITPSITLGYVNNIELSYSRIMANNVADAVKSQLSCAQILEMDANHVRYANEYGVSTLNFGVENPSINGFSYDTQSYMTKTVQLWVTGTRPNYTVEVQVATAAGTAGKTGALYTLKREFRQLNSQ